MSSNGFYNCDLKKIVLIMFLKNYIFLVKIIVR